MQGWCFRRFHLGYFCYQLQAILVMELAHSQEDGSFWFLRSVHGQSKCDVVCRTYRLFIVHWDNDSAAVQGVGKFFHAAQHTGDVLRHGEVIAAVDPL